MFKPEETPRELETLAIVKHLERRKPRVMHTENPVDCELT
jgi:hypothetical protein